MALAVVASADMPVPASQACFGPSASNTLPRSASEGAPLKLKKLILLSRHGIRTPYPSTDMGQTTYSQFSRDKRAWPETPADWGAAGEEHLTTHGMTVRWSLFPVSPRPTLTTTIPPEVPVAPTLHVASHAHHNASTREVFRPRCVTGPPSQCSQCLVTGRVPRLPLFAHSLRFRAVAYYPTP